MNRIALCFMTQTLFFLFFYYLFMLRSDESVSVIPLTSDLLY